MIRIVGISGKMGSGKTATSKALENMLKNQNLYVVRLRFAEHLYVMHDGIRAHLAKYKDILEGHGIKYDFTEKDRELLQWLGTEWGRSINENIWSVLARADVDRNLSLSDKSVILFEDLRYPNEFDCLHDGLRVRLECPFEVRKERGESVTEERRNHSSETGLDEYSAQGKFDMYFHTDKEPLDDVVKGIYERVMNGG